MIIHLILIGAPIFNTNNASGPMRKRNGWSDDLYSVYDEFSGGEVTRA